MSDLFIWTRSQRFILIVDQLNSLEPSALGRSAENKNYTRGLIQRLGDGHLVVRGYSANNETARALRNKQRSARDVEWFGGYTQVVL